MRREILILLCVIFLGIGTVGCVTMLETREQTREVAWWSLIFERPNPDQLPVQVRFRLLGIQKELPAAGPADGQKGLNSSGETDTMERTEKYGDGRQYDKRGYGDHIRSSYGGRGSEYGGTGARGGIL